MLNAKETSSGEFSDEFIHSVSVLVQQVLFYLMLGRKIMLQNILEWAVWAPIALIWIMYVIAPFVYARPLTPPVVLRSYGKAGWFFVGFAIAWTLAFDVLCNKYGCPLNSEDVDELYNLGRQQKMNSWKQHTNQ